MTDRISPAGALNLHGRSVDFDAGLVRFGSRTRRLTHQAGEVLKALVAAAPAVCTRDELIETIWGGNYPVGNRSLPSVIYALRRALDEQADQPIIKTCPRIGYRLLPTPHPCSENDGFGGCQKVPDSSLRKRRIRIAATLGVTSLVLVSLFKLVGPDVQIRVTDASRSLPLPEAMPADASQFEQSVQPSRRGDETAVQTPDRRQD